MSAFAAFSASPKKKEISPYLLDLMGNAVVLFGSPMVGKSSLCVKMARKLYEYTGKPAYYVAIDSNLKGPFGEQLKKESKAQWVELSDPRAIVKTLYPAKDWSKYSAVIVDSITGLMEYVVDDVALEAFLKDGVSALMDPRINLAMSRMAAIITSRLGEIAKKYKVAAVLVSHPTPVFRGDWLGIPVKPAFAERSIKNVDGVIWMYVKKPKDGPPRRVVRIVVLRGKREHEEVPIEQFLGE